MKKLGLVLIVFGLALIIFAIFFAKNKNREISPIPDPAGINVIYVSPSQ